MLLKIAIKINSSTLYSDKYLFLTTKVFFLKKNY